jgi:hypothetical protein
MQLNKHNPPTKTVGVFLPDYEFLRALQSQISGVSLTELVHDAIEVYKKFNTEEEPVQEPVVVSKVIQAPNIRFIPAPEPVVKTTPIVKDEYSYVEPTPAPKSLLNKFLNKGDS